ncbi:MAG: hypothetical protein QGG60_09565 [Anaerolineales bacterium]|nr:hypothetical protein [Anaerolineales bacterium]
MQFVCIRLQFRHVTLMGFHKGRQRRPALARMAARLPAGDLGRDYSMATRGNPVRFWLMGCAIMAENREAHALLLKTSLEWR